MANRNNFGHMGVEYSAARRGYPNEVFEYVKYLSKEKNSKILDLGCGTGISTRQLKGYFSDVTGADKDQLMIDQALRQSADIPYIVTNADDLPFKSRQFDIVTAFTAFHWFNDEKSLKEIKRVLKHEGLLFVALKTNRKDENEDFRKGYHSILKKFAGEDYDATYKHHEVELMLKVGFSNLRQKSFFVDEKYTVEEALVLLRSLSLWNLVKEADRPRMLEEMKKFYENHLTKGFVVRKREIVTTSASPL